MKKRLDKIDYLFTLTPLNNIQWTVEIGTNKKIILEDLGSWALTLFITALSIFIVFWVVLRKIC